MRRERKQGAATSLVVATAVLALVLMASGAAAQSRVFVTSMAYTGDLKTEGFGLPGCGGGTCADGLEGADAICNQRASDAGLGGSWVAWLSTSSKDAKDRLFENGITGPFLRAAGTPATPHIADDLADLTDGSLDDAILNDEFGAPRLLSVWTGTTPLGVEFLPPNHCSDWADAAAQAGVVGMDYDTDPEWTLAGFGSCRHFPSSLYCFEVPPAPVPASSPAGLAVSMLLALTGLAVLYRRQQIG